MVGNYLKVAYRNLRKHKIYSFINILGLAIGIACCIMIFLYVFDEMTYDRFHDNADRIYRLYEEVQLRTGIERPAALSGPVGPAMKSEFPEVTEYTRLFKYPDQDKVVIKYQDTIYEEENLFFADTTFFDVFTFPFIDKNSSKLLIEPGSIVITEEIAKKYFGDENPLDKIITISNAFAFKVSAVVRNVPHNSHFTFSFLLPIMRLDDMYKQFALDDWRDHSFYTYLLLGQQEDAISLEEKFPQFITKYRHHGARTEEFLKFHLQPITSIHLYSDLSGELEINSTMKYVFIFSSVALIILLTACFNFMNLSTARSSIRAKEVGVRKVVGARRPQLMNQFIGEALLMSSLAFLLSLGMVEILIPYFNAITGRELAIVYTGRASIWVYLTGMSVLVGLISGSYPALFLSSFKPANVLKGTLSTRSTKTLFRKSLVVIQFGISVMLIIGTTIILTQMSYIRNKDMGFDYENVLTIKLKNQFFNRSYHAIKAEFLTHNNVLGVTASSELPVNILNSTEVSWLGGNIEEPPAFKFIAVDFDFLDMYNFTLLEGRGFSQSIVTDTLFSVILNEAAANYTGVDSILNSRFNTIEGARRATVVGLVKDFHFASLYEPIEPVVIFPASKNTFGYISVKMRPENTDITLGHLRTVIQKIDPGQPFEYLFLEDYYDSLYRDEESMAGIFIIFSVLAITIACLGLFGLVSFTAEERTNEIGIRKILGAKVHTIVTLLIRDFSKTVVIANMLSWPAAYYIMNRWLQGFAYRAEIDPWMFITAGAITVLLALFTVSYQTVKAAITNPVDALRYE